MNRIQRILTFLHDYQDLNPYLKDICRHSYTYYQKEYLRVSRHPYPDEYLDLDCVRWPIGNQNRTLQSMLDPSL